MSGEVVHPAADDEPGAPHVNSTEARVGQARPRRRFGRTRPVAIDHGHDESVASLHAELVLLREENARLKAQRHQDSNVASLLGKARSARSTAADLESVTDDTAQMLVDGLVMRESLLEICQEIERAMVAFQAKLNALAAPAEEVVAAAETTKGHGPAVA